MFITLSEQDETSGPSVPFHPVGCNGNVSATQAGNNFKSARQKIHVSVHEPLRLYQLGEHWHDHHDPSAGWELVRALRCDDARTRAIAAEMLAKTEQIHLPMEAVRRAGRSRKVGYQARKEGEEVEESKGQKRFQFAEFCHECEHRKRGWFCGLSQDGLKILETARHPATYPSDAVLFAEGQTARGAFVLCSGKVKLFTTSREGRIFIVRVAVAGEVLGLSAAITGQNHTLTAETSGSCHVNFLARRDLVTAIEKNAEFGLRASVALSYEFQSMYRDIHDLVLAPTSEVKLARLLLSWTGRGKGTAGNPEIRIPSTLTHEEMAQMIGASRETVTRLLGDLKKRDFIRVEGSTLVIRDRTALEQLTA